MSVKLNCLPITACTDEQHQNGADSVSLSDDEEDVEGREFFFKNLENDFCENLSIYLTMLLLSIMQNFFWALLFALNANNKEKQASLRN